MEVEMMLTFLNANKLDALLFMTTQVLSQNHNKDFFFSL